MKKWVIKKTNREFVLFLAGSAGISPVTAQILINRDVKTPQEVLNFFSSDISSITDPFQLSGMDKAVQRIQKTLPNGNILVYGDYDADGVTATAILVETLRELGGKVSFFIPSRFEHGYGFHESAVESAKKSGTDLIITVDCGITSFEAVSLAGKYGIDVIVTDHHEPQRVYSENNDSNVELKLPEAYAIINPKVDMLTQDASRAGTLNLGTQNLSGAGVSLMLSLALYSGKSVEIVEKLDLAALGTIADMVPLTGVNRLIVKQGASLMNSGDRVGIKYLMDGMNLNGRIIGSGLLSFTLIPRINAAGRMGDAMEAVKLFITDSANEAKEIVSKLNQLNSERQKVEEGVLKSALSQIEKKGFEKAIVVFDENWHEGVLGIVASRLAKKFNTPAFVFCSKNGDAVGSARSVEQFDICKSLAHCSQQLIRYGGHKQAAGLKIKEENLYHFENMINEYIKNQTTDETFVSTISIDSELQLKEINHDLLLEFSKLTPHGYGNPEPVIGSKGLTVLNPRIVGKNHLKMKLGHNGFFVDTIGFDLGDNYSMIASSEKVDAVYTPTINDWEGLKSIQLNIKALRPCM